MDFLDKIDPVYYMLLFGAFTAALIYWEWKKVRDGRQILLSKYDFREYEVPSNELRNALFAELFKGLEKETQDYCTRYRNAWYKYLFTGSIGQIDCMILTRPGRGGHTDYMFRFSEADGPDIYFGEPSELQPYFPTMTTVKTSSHSFHKHGRIKSSDHEAAICFTERVASHAIELLKYKAPFSLINNVLSVTKSDYISGKQVAYIIPRVINIVQEYKALFPKDSANFA